MSGTAWSKFFWSDWANDPALRLCSLAAQGLWMRMLCIAAEADPTGFITVNGRTLEASDIARLAGVSEGEVSDLLSELDRNGVFSRDRTGRTYSRRMVRDAKAASRARKYGARGGNPSLSKRSGISPQDNPPLKPPDKPHKPYANSQSEKEQTSSVSKKRQGTRLPADWEPDRAYATAQGLSEAKTDREAERFRNHWTATPGQRGVKLDWAATWRNWVLKAAEGLGSGPGPPSNGAKPDWEARAKYFEKTGQWLDMHWGDKRAIPPEFRHRFEGLA